MLTPEEVASECRLWKYSARRMIRACFSVSSLVGLLVLTGCEKQAPPAPAPADSGPARVGRPELPPELTAAPSAAPPVPPAPPAPTAWSIPPSFPPNYEGAWFAVTSLGAGVYTEPRFESTKLGYMRGGSRVPINSEPVSKKNCKGGWYELVSGGYVCGNLGTTDLNHPEVKFGTRQPNVAEVLPYPYARNAKHGTPLYRSVPSREQMEHYEPYLLEKKKEAETAVASTQGSAGATATPSAAAPDLRRNIADAGAQPPLLAAPLSDGGLIAASVAADPEMEKPWWQRENIKDRLHEVRLEELEAEADEVLAKRMVTGFYVAVDKTFRWNGRAWYKTTKGLVAPTERFWQTTGSSFKGLEVDGTTVQLPLGWVYGGRKSAGTYTIDPTTNKLDTAGTVERFAAVQLTGESLEVRGTHYEKLRDGTWIKRSHIRKTAPGPAPAGLAANERWIDVNLETQTVVAFVGDRPVYATLMSSGKESKIEEKDHRTPVGEWRVREKHITTTMDGDGSAAGDLPYSIEDVPYAMFYHKAYALHAAFWHSNYGVQMSHGCVNLSPLDAKHLFFFADPPIPAGLHGVWSSESNPGTRVVVHE
jgi:lipoprotein-anchoring transpeptidase ErfK/SrfK